MAGEKSTRKPSTSIFNKFFSVRDWTKYPLALTTMFLIFLWKATAISLEESEARVQELQVQLNKCNEARTQDAKDRTEQDRRILDRYIEQSLQRSAEKILQPKIDSISNL